jgi:hypothetical protein
LACGALLPDRVSRVGVVSSWGPIDELQAAYASLTAAERHLVSAIRADPAAATERLWESGQWFADNPLRFLEAAPEAADAPVLRDPQVRSTLAASNLEGARQGQTGLVGDWVADALPWGFRLADISVSVDLWIGERDPGRAPLDAPEIERRIPSCAVHADADAGALAAHLALARDRRTLPLLTKRWRRARFAWKAAVRLVAEAAGRARVRAHEG